MNSRFSFRRKELLLFVLIYIGLSTSFIGYLFRRTAPKKVSLQFSPVSPLGSKLQAHKNKNGEGNPSTVVYSAFVDTVEASGKEEEDYYPCKRKVILIAWQKSNVINDAFKCCILTSAHIAVSSRVIKATQCCYDMGLIRARRVECPVNGTYLDIQGVSLAHNDTNCSNNVKDYVTPKVLSSNLKENKWAICIKYIYGRGPNSKKLVEWFEFYRSLGVDKILVHFETTIQSSTKTVLQYYQMNGLADVLEINAPFKDTINRHNHSPRSELFNDEQVGLWNCRERLKYYNYVGDLDTDEFILPHDIAKNPTRKTLTDAFRGNVGVVTFFTYVHITSWKKTNITSLLQIGQYGEATEPLIEAPKNMFMPSRVKYGEGTVHTVYPKAGFSRIFLDPVKAAVHHFRLCRRQWLDPFTAKIYRNGTVKYLNVTCYNFKRVRFSPLKQINVSKMERKILQVYTQLRI